MRYYINLLRFVLSVPFIVLSAISILCGNLIAGKQATGQWISFFENQLTKKNKSLVKKVAKKGKK